MRTYIDTSVLAAYYCPEPGSAAAERVLQHTEPVISLLCEVELMSVLARKVRERSMSKVSAMRISDLFLEHLSAGHYIRVAISPAQFEAARNILARHETKLRTLDALHLSVVAENKTALVTADRALHEAAKKRGVASRLLAGQR